MGVCARSSASVFFGGESQARQGHADGGLAHAQLEFLLEHLGEFELGEVWLLCQPLLQGALVGFEDLLSVASARIGQGFETAVELVLGDPASERGVADFEALSGLTHWDAIINMGLHGALSECFRMCVSHLLLLPGLWSFGTARLVSIPQ